MNIYIGSIKIFRRTGCFIQCRQPGKRTHSHYKKWQIIPKQRWNIVKISFLILCAEIVEFIFSYCFTGYVNFFDLLVKLNYFVNSFSSLYRNVLYDPVQKKRLIAPRSSQLYSLCISIENQGLFQLQIFACCLQKVFVLKTLKKMRY